MSSSSTYEPEEQRERGGIPGRGRAERDAGVLGRSDEPYHRREFDPARRIILHCASGGRSALAADTLRQMGYTNVAHLDGGSRLERGGPTGRESIRSHHLMTGEDAQDIPVWLRRRRSHSVLTT